jgi:DNA-binding Lrp family transcriptional regulator
MTLEQFKISVSALSGEHTVDILLYLKERGWSIALDVAKGLGLHPTTVMGYLEKLHAAGYLSRRKKKTRTGKTHEYRLKSDRITLELDLGSEDSRRESIPPVVSLIARIAQGLERIGSPLDPSILEDEKERNLVSLIFSGEELKAGTMTKDDSDLLCSVLRKVIEFSERSLGKAMTRSIILSTYEQIPSDLLEFMPDYVQEAAP